MIYLNKCIISIGFIIGLFIFLIACSNVKEENDKESNKLNQIFDDYFEELIELFPTFATYIGDNRYNDIFPNYISEEHISKQKKLYTEYLKKISEINRETLQSKDVISYDIFKFDMKLSLEGLNYKDNLMPIDQMGGTPSYFAMFGSGSSIQPF